MSILSRSQKNRILLGISTFIGFFTQKTNSMLVNSKEIAEDVKGAIVEAGNQVTSEFKNVIETSKPLWPNKYSCLTILGFLITVAGLFFIFKGIMRIINTHGRHEDDLKQMNEDKYSVKRGLAKIIIGIIIFCIGLYAIHRFGI